MLCWRFAVQLFENVFDAPINASVALACVMLKKSIYFGNRMYKMPKIRCYNLKFVGKIISLSRYIKLSSFSR